MGSRLPKSIGAKPKSKAFARQLPLFTKFFALALKCAAAGRYLMRLEGGTNLLAGLRGGVTQCSAALNFETGEV
ncbi:hypothetical protein DD557_13605 [Thalassobacter stenotrophicus]|nr:hypothetical protein DD557_13605 [Thalassobacter stenotrophicus]